jgi:hypothetical protein
MSNEEKKTPVYEYNFSLPEIIHIHISFLFSKFRATNVAWDINNDDDDILKSESIIAHRNEESINKDSESTIASIIDSSDVDSKEKFDNKTCRKNENKG